MTTISTTKKKWFYLFWKKTLLYIFNVWFGEFGQTIFWWIHENQMIWFSQNGICDLFIWLPIYIYIYMEFVLTTRQIILDPRQIIIGFSFSF